ncbi:hypothetical protein OAH41_01485 [Paracoccaceae bacterium]|nr:hypothetical protein [Paracoccaceae bacterium]
MKLFLTLLTICTVINPEINIFNVVDASGGRLSQGINIDGQHVKLSKLSVGIKLFDILFLIVLIDSLIKGKVYKLNKLILHKYSYIILLFIITLMAWPTFSNAQMLTSMLYFAKFCSSIIIATLLVKYNVNINLLQKIMHPNRLKILLLITTLNGFIIISTNYGYKFAFDNRTEYFGALGLLYVFVLNLQKSLGKKFTIWDLLLFATIVCVAFYSGKRGPSLALMLSLAVFMYTSVNYKFKLILMLSAPIAIVGFMSFQIFNVDSYQINNLSQEYREALNVLPGDLLVDKSSLERLAKILVTTEYFESKPFIGYGFWASPLVLDFLPDSLLQTPLENGALGTLAILSIFLSKFSHSVNDQAYRRIQISMFTYLLFIGISSNVFYLFQITSCYFILLALYDLLLRGSRKNA